jgi:hypothetical protein
VRHPDPPREDDVLPGLRHGTVLGGHDEDRRVELGRTGDHVLHVVGVPWHVDVRVVPGGGLVLDVRDVDRDAAGLLLRRPVDPLEPHVGGGGGVQLGQGPRDGGGERGLPVVDVPHRADVEVRLGAREPLLGHDFPLVWNDVRRTV